MITQDYLGIYSELLRNSCPYLELLRNWGGGCTSDYLVSLRTTQDYLKFTQSYLGIQVLLELFRNWRGWWCLEYKELLRITQELLRIAQEFMSLLRFTQELEGVCAQITQNYLEYLDYLEKLRIHRLLRILRSLRNPIDLSNCPAIQAPPLAPQLDSFALKWATSQSIKKHSYLPLSPRAFKVFLSNLK